MDKRKYYIGIDAGARHTSIVCLEPQINGNILEKVGIVFIGKAMMPETETSRNDYERFNSFRDDLVGTFKEIRDYVEHVKNQEGRDYELTIAMEKPMSFKLQGNGIYVHYAYAIIMVALDKIFSQRCETYHPSSYKRIIAGNGRADKDDVRRAILRQFGYNIADADDVDAFAVAACNMFIDLGLAAIAKEAKHKRVNRKRKAVR
jgi:Holliday junction resolvasome RuvABC endonuclease subunit